MAANARAMSRPLPRPVQRDKSTDSQTRNKENVPSSSPTRSSFPAKGRSFIPSLAHSDKSDFFTDSYLADDHASPTSLIPSPLLQSTAIPRPRRKFNPVNVSRDQDARPKHRPTPSDVSIDTPRHSPPTHQKPLAYGDSPAPSTGLTTPPRSRDGSLTESPTNNQFSSPPRALTETYERIDQEEDLAATEGEISDSESEKSQIENGRVPSGHVTSRGPLVVSSQYRIRSPGTTPTDAKFRDLEPRVRDEDLTNASVLSDPTGMSFVNQLSDQNIAHAMTPHVLQSAADKEALRKIWDSKRPVAFGKANKIHLDADEVADSVESPPRLPPPRLIAFSKAGKRKLTNDLARIPLHQRTFSDVTDRIEHPTQETTYPTHNDNWHNDQLRREAIPHNPRIHRVPYFPRTHGFPERQTAGETDDHLQRLRQSRSESPFAQSLQLENSRQNANSGGLQDLRRMSMNHSEPDLTLQSRLPTQVSEADCMQAAVNEPVRTSELESRPRSQSRLSDTSDYGLTPEKSRKFDVDFTGQSFQVSESPPVRSKNLALNTTRDMEIRGLAKRAVTTSRLTQLRARESLERMRSGSQSPLAENEQPRDNKVRKESDSKPEDIPDTPVFIYRSNSIGSGRNSSGTPPVRPSPDRSQSHDLLQRLAGRSGSTPRSTTPSDRSTRALDGQEDQKGGEDKARTTSDAQQDNDDTIQGSIEPFSAGVKATPKVTGAWTDTILPDTVRMTKQVSQQSLNMKTPHVNAGGWIDTPAPITHISRLDPVPESTQEILEELTNGIVKDNSTVSDKTIIAADPAKSTVQVPPQMAQSLAKKVLAEAKDKQQAQNVNRTTPNVDDTLVLGNATLQSLENVLDMDETDITILSRLGESNFGQSDTEVLDRLTSKLDRLRSHISDARNGISKIESQIAQEDSQQQQLQTLPALVAPATSTSCTTCSQIQPAGQTHVHLPDPVKSKTYLPFALLNITLPVPILFRTRPNSRLPRPTPLGYLLLALWTWYLLECTLSEIFSHPTYTSHAYIWPTEQEPEFPFVLPTMLWRWSRLRWVYGGVVAPLLRVVTGFVRMLGIWCGFIDGWADGERVRVEVMERVVETVLMGVEGGVDMMNDEFI